MSLPSAKKKLSDYVSFGLSIMSCCCSFVNYGSGYTYCHVFVELGMQNGNVNSNSDRISSLKKCFSTRTTSFSGLSSNTLVNSKFNSNCFR